MNSDRGVEDGQEGAGLEAGRTVRGQVQEPSWETITGINAVQYGEKKEQEEGEAREPGTDWLTGR